MPSSIKTPRFLYLASPANGKPMKQDRFLIAWVCLEGGTLPELNEPFPAPEYGSSPSLIRINLRTLEFTVLETTELVLINPG
jgi:hypothetical protein